MTPRTTPTVLLFATVLSFLGLAVAASDVPIDGDPSRAQPVYEKYCVTCHGEEGEGDGVMAKFLDTRPKDFTNVEYMETRTDQQLYTSIAEGGAAVGLSDKMAPWKHVLSEQEMKDLTLYVRELQKAGDGE